MKHLRIAVLGISYFGEEAISELKDRPEYQRVDPCGTYSSKFYTLTDSRDDSSFPANLLFDFDLVILVGKGGMEVQDLFLQIEYLLHDECFVILVSTAPDLSTTPASITVQNAQDAHKALQMILDSILIPTWISIDLADVQAVLGERAVTFFDIEISEANKFEEPDIFSGIPKTIRLFLMVYADDTLGMHEVDHIIRWAVEDVPSEAKIIFNALTLEDKKEYFRHVFVMV